MIKKKVNLGGVYKESNLILIQMEIGNINIKNKDTKLLRYLGIIKMSFFLY